MNPQSRLTDRQLNDRIATLQRALSTLADRHCQLIDELRPEHPEPWTEETLYPPLLLNPLVYDRPEVIVIR